MKVVNYSADGSNVKLLLEPENPAEVALFSLMANCEATFSRPDPGPEDPNSEGPKLEEKLSVLVVVKKSRY